ncbi:putative quinol monooxygenase [Desulfoluna spongiiphila]
MNPARKEPGCLWSDLPQDNENPAVFLILEQWEGRIL